MRTKDFISIVREDLEFHAGKSFIRKILVFFFNMPFRLVLNYRLGHFLGTRRNPFINILILILKKHQIKHRNCDISYQAQIGRRIKFPHPLGIVIGENSKIGDDVMIWHNVTLGSHGKEGILFEYPIIGNSVKLYAGCKIIGNVRICKNSKVGANAVVLNDVEENQVVGGIPAKILK